MFLNRKGLKFPLSLRGLFYCFGVILFVYAVDLFVGRLLIGSLSLRHFSWHLKELFSLGAIGSFLNGAILHKSGILGSKFFNLSLIFFYFFASVVLWRSILGNRGGGSDGVRNGIVKRFVPQSIFGFVLIFLIIKQLLFVFVIPPWQTPDETYHYLYVGSYLSEPTTLNERIAASLEKFNFKKQSELAQIPHLGSDISSIRNRQLPFSYLISSQLIKAFGLENLPNALYVCRLISSLSMVVTVILIYFIALALFQGIYKKVMAQWVMLFVAVLPQASYIGATTGGEAMMIMFVTAALLVMILALREYRSNNKLALFYSLAIIFSFLATATKLQGASVFAPLLISGVAIYFMRFVLSIKSDMKERLLYSVAPILLLLIIFVIVWNSDSMGIRNFVNARVFPYLHGLTYKGMWYADMRKSAILFVSFWLSYGWSVFKMSIGSYLFLGLVTMLSIVGVIKSLIKDEIGIDKKSYLLLLFYMVICLLAFKQPEGRYFYVFIAPFSIAFVTGIYSIIPTKYRESGMKIFAGNLILFNALVVFGILIPVFYLI